MFFVFCFVFGNNLVWLDKLSWYSLCSPMWAPESAGRRDSFSCLFHGTEGLYNDKTDKSLFFNIILNLMVLFWVVIMGGIDLILPCVQSLVHFCVSWVLICRTLHAQTQLDGCPSFWNLFLFSVPRFHSHIVMWVWLLILKFWARFVLAFHAVFSIW